LRQSVITRQRKWPIRLIMVMALVMLVRPTIPADATQAPVKKTIRSVKVQGNLRVAADLILEKIRSRKGATFNEQQINEDAQKLLAMPQVYDVSWEVRSETDQVDLVFIITESDLIEKIELRGNKRIKDKKLLEGLQFKKNDPLDVFLIRGGQEAIKEIYLKKGYYSVQVNIDQAALKEARKVIYDIVEGPRLRVKKVSFQGNETIPKWKLKKQVKTKPYKFIFRKGLLDDLQLEQDSLALSNYYHGQGFLDARVFARKKLNPAKSRGEIEFIIEEGLRYRVVEIEFSNNERFGVEELAQVVKLQTGDVLTEKRKKLTEQAVKRKYGQEGYVYCEVNIEQVFTDREGEVLVKIVVNEGRDYFLKRLVVKGNYRTQDKVIRRAFDYYDFLPGHLYDTDAMAKGQKRLRESSLIKSVMVTPVGHDPNSRDALVEVQEQQTGIMTFGVGVGSNDGVFGQFSIRERNFDINKMPKTPKEWKELESLRGAGQTLNMSLFPGTEEVRGNILFREPYLNDKPIYLETDIFLFRRYQESYRERRAGGRVTLGRRFKNNWSADVGIRIQNVKISDLDKDPNGNFVGPSAVEDVEGSNLLNSVKFGVGYNATDSLVRPTKGYKYHASYEYFFKALGGEFDFSKCRIGASYFQPIHEDLAERKTVWSSMISYGTILGQAPVFERFYVGGIGSMRGFDYRGISLRDGQKNDPFGSDFQVLAGTELTYPLYEETVYGKVFYDTAMIEEGPVRMAIGFGLEIIIPQLFQQVPMQLNFATPVKESDEDDTEVFSFSFGFHF
jgi:outer membrane protein insertion porin family